MSLRASSEFPARPHGPQTRGGSPRALVRSALLGLLAFASCAEGREGLEIDGRGRYHEQPRLYTLYDIKRALLRGEPIARTKSVPAGLAPGEFLSPTVEDDTTLRILPAFSEGNAAGYVVTSVWAEIGEIWAQPWYFLVDRDKWNPAMAQASRLTDAAGNRTPPIFDPGPDSRFYSPFWIVYYVPVPPTTAPDKYTSSKQLEDDGLLDAKHLGTAFTYDVRPEDVTLLPPESLPDARPRHPFVGTDVGVVSQGATMAYVDGKEYPYLNQGSNNFNYNETLVVEEVPLFTFVRQQDGQPFTFQHADAEWQAPRVMGSVPLFSRRSAEIAAAGPRFGAYSRLHVAILPPAAAVYPATPELDAKLVEAKLDPKAFIGRIAFNGGGMTGCFAAMTFPTSCVWLDSQAKIEEVVGRFNIRPTEITMASPLVFFAGKGIGR